jgi:hypothetical protein
MTHALKTWPEFFKDISSGSKTFELRKDDRGFKPGDSVLLQEWDPSTKKYTGEEIQVRITCLFRSISGLKSGYCIFGFEKAF